MHLSIIVAVAANQAIGKDNQLLWHLPNDLKFFKNTTWGMPVIMGRKTFESVNKILPGRTNIVITRQASWEMAGVITADTLETAISKAASTNCKEAFIIGGGEIYRQALPLCQTVYLTRVHAIIEGEIYFPVLDEKEWTCVSSEDFEKDEKHAYAYSFQKWEKNNQIKSS